ncbi:hypothetical protein BST92_10785 [Nonlabens arenilitoris]|uniref:YobI-like P-loop NTPase domain-containing protein n=1 Tax=Nonlabens arenilitoris TaxID=1217969 RepID=A0A2S7UCN7_9FLAO|nr:P-loop NTPase fold protein [Nonlabens arenilitoris]PQJ32380.1 hypothetical protein BST92_10785 [Nonlabens arenilitoris]
MNTEIKNKEISRKQQFKNWLNKKLILFSTRFLLEKQEPILNNEKERSFNSLSPVSDVIQHKQYCDALNWALQNRKKEDIKNIALTGTYGSGKSSILKTLQETNEDNSLHFLNISLASFKDEPYLNEEGEQIKLLDNAKIAARKDQLRLIELSILQQIFYHEEQKNIPDSRFKKVRSFTNQNLKKASFLVLLFIGCVVYLLYLPKIQDSIGIDYLKSYRWVNIIFKVLSLLTIIFLSYYLVKRLIQFFQKFTVNKLNFNSLEIEVSEKVDKSILNHHIDEILYFFEASDYNVVIVEDLDRFKQTEIFTKLREVNLLINNSKPINKHVVFIYAVRDEMFQGSERTKFFDFIVPVIPVINYSNSKEKLLSSLKAHNYEVHLPLINEIAFFIDDMRLLYNIANEFAIYKQKLQSSKHNQQKLLALIVYKNLHPSDFVDLLNQEGVLYQILHISKAVLLVPKTEALELKVSSLEKEIDKLKQIRITDEIELRKKYVLEILISSPDNKSANYIRMNNQNYRPKVLIEDSEMFELLTKQNYQGYDNRNGQFSFNLRFSDLEQKIHPGYTYRGYMSQINKINIGKISNLKNEIDTLKEQLNKVHRLPIKDLIVDKKIDKANAKQSNLIYSLVSLGFIAEDYLDYISYFYEGDLSRADFAFIMDNRNNKRNDFDFVLDNVQSVFNKMSVIHFERSSCLNFQLIDYVVGNLLLDEKSYKILAQFNNEEAIYRSFVFDFIDRNIKVTQFISRVFSDSKKLWKNILIHEPIESVRLIKLVEIMVSSLSVDSINELEDNDSLIDFINKNPLVLNKIDKNRKDDLFFILDIKVENLSEVPFESELFENLESFQNYEMNIENIRSVLKNHDVYDEKLFLNSNYTAIIESGIDSLIDYVEVEISDYVRKVFCQIKENNQESTDSLMKLLNNVSLDVNWKENVLVKSDNKIVRAQDFDFYNEMRNFLMTNTGLEPNWNNVIYDYSFNENTITEKLLVFLNNKKNAIALSQNSNGLNGKENLNFRETFILNDHIDNLLYEMYLNVFPQAWDGLNIQGLSIPKIELLIKNKRYDFSEPNYIRIENYYPKLLPLYLGVYLKEFNKYLIEKKIDESIMADILKSLSLTAEEKISLIEIYDKNHSISSVKLLEQVLSVFLRENSLNLRNETKFEILDLENLKREHRIKLITSINKNLLDSEYLRKELIKMGGDYEKLTEYGPMPSFTNTLSNQLFFDLLLENDMVSKVIPKGNKIKVTTFK